MEVISTRRYEARPPADSHASILVDPANSVATVKEEEWETRKKKEITTTRQIETRVKRQVVLEDGEVVVDSGPLVTTNTTEDVEQQEHTTQERRTTGDEPQKVEWPAAKSGAVVQKELNETIVKSREEIEELLETEDRQQLGDITDEAYLQAVRNNRGDLRVALAESKRQLASQQSTGPRVLQHTTRSNKVVDTEKTLERSELKQDGQIVTERKTTVEHEEIKDDELPEGIGDRDEVDEAREYRKEATQRYAKTRDEEIVDYLHNGERVGREMRFVSEQTEAERTGDWPGEPPAAATSLRNRLHKQHGFTTEPPPTRKEAPSRGKPLDLEEEDEARKFETSKWLESHFGSESRSSHGSLDEEPASQAQHGNTSFINVTMKSSCAPARLERRSYKKEQTSRTNGRESTSPSGYFQGISEWSERYQSTEKQTSHTRARSPQYIVESNREVSRVNGHHPSTERNHKETTYSRTYESSRRHQEQRHSPAHERPKVEPPSPPLRRKAREQVITTRAERSYTPERAASPVHVVQRTWESRSRDERRSGGRSSAEHSSARRQQRDYSPERTRQRPRTPISRSPSPARRPASPHRRKDEQQHSRPSKSPSPSKYKIGESFRKLVGKLRSASSERRNKRPAGGSSTSQLTQTDDSSTYLQYNSVDRNVPLGPDYDTDDRPPERPPRSPRNATASNGPPVQREAKSSKYRSSPRPASPRHAEYKETRTEQRSEQRSEQRTEPIHRYYLGEDPYGGSIYGKEKGYRETRLHSSRHRGRPIEEEYSAQESGSLGRFSKSTSRLANEFEQTDSYHRTAERTSSAQTLPRKIHHHHVSSSNSNNLSSNINNLGSNINNLGSNSNSLGSNSNNHNNQSTMSSSTRQQHSTTTTTRRMTNGHSSSPVSRYNSQSQESSSRPQYGSMINISFRNHVTSPPKTTHFVQSSISTQPPVPPPAPQKPERTYKSTLSRSKSFNVEIADDGVVAAPKTNGFSNGYSSGNVRSSTQLNKLDETPPLKSPGILASISRSNRDLMMRNGKHDY